MPKHRDKPHHRHHHRESSASFVDAGRLERALSPWIPDASQRGFLIRCVLKEGPRHHRGANYVLLGLLLRLVERLGVRGPAQGPTRPFPMRLPPHLEDEIEDDAWPIEIPEHALRELAGGEARDVDEMIDCLTDGPPQHAIANVLMVQLLEALLRQVEKPG